MAEIKLQTTWKFDFFSTFKLDLVMSNCTLHVLMFWHLPQQTNCFLRFPHPLNPLVFYSPLEFWSPWRYCDWSYPFLSDNHLLFSSEPWQQSLLCLPHWPLYLWRYVPLVYCAWWNFCLPNHSPLEFPHPPWSHKFSVESLLSCSNYPITFHLFIIV